MQVRVLENPTHAFLGQWHAPVAMRKNINGMLKSPVTIFWNIEKKLADCSSSPPSCSSRPWRRG